MSDVPSQMMNHSSVDSARSDITEWSSDFKDTSSAKSFKCSKTKIANKKRVDFKIDNCCRNRSRITIKNAKLSNSSDSETNDEVCKSAPAIKETTTIIALNNKLIKNREIVRSKTSLLYDKDEGKDYKKFVIEDLDQDMTDNEHVTHHLSDDELYDDFDEENAFAVVNVKSNRTARSKSSISYTKNEGKNYKKIVIEDFDQDITDNENVPHHLSDDELYDDFDEERTSASVDVKSNPLVATSSDEIDKEEERQKKDLTVEYVEHQLVEAFKKVCRDVILSSSIAQLFRAGGRPNEQKNKDMPEQNFIQQSNRLRIYDSFPSSSSSAASTDRTNVLRSPKMHQTPRTERPRRKAAFIPNSKSATFAADRYEEEEKRLFAEAKKWDKLNSKNKSSSNGSMKNPKKNTSKQICCNGSQKSLLEQARNKTKVYDTHPNGSSSQIKQIDYGKAKKFILKAMARNKAKKMNQQPNKCSSSTKGCCFMTQSGCSIEKLKIIFPKTQRNNHLRKARSAGTMQNNHGQMEKLKRFEDFPFNVKYDRRRVRKRHSKRKQRKSFGFTKERVREIERQNRILLKKILAHRPAFMFDTKPYLNKIREKVGPPAKKLSNSAVNRKKLQRKIDQENRLLKRKIEAIFLRRRQL